MFKSPWVYQLVIPALLILLWCLFFGVSHFAHAMGVKAKKNHELHLTDIVPANILGLLALILGFTLSMAISRYDLRRELIIRETNAIETAFMRADLIKPVPGYDLKKLYRDYVDTRINYYKMADPEPPMKAAEVLKTKIWGHIIEVTKLDRTDIEGEYIEAVNNMVEATNSRNYAIQVKLPIAIYLMILLIACTAIGMLRFDSGYNDEKTHWRPAILTILLGVVIILIFDLDHPRIGMIEVSQQALIDLRNSM